MAVTLTGATVVPNCTGVVVGDLCILTAEISGYEAPLFKWWYKAPGAGSFTMIADYGEEDETYAWDTSGVEPNGVASWQVWIKETGSGEPYDEYDALSLWTWPTTRLPDGLVDDQVMLVSSFASATAKRAEVIAYWWGTAGYPTGYPSVMKDVASPVVPLSNLLRVDRLDLAQEVMSEYGVVTVNNKGYLFIPCNNATRKTTLVMLLDGHFLDDFDRWQYAIAPLVNAGYTVCATHMPEWYGPDHQYKLSSPAEWGEDLGISSHAWLSKHVPYSATEGGWWRCWTELAIRALNYCENEQAAGELPAFKRYVATGLSGGGLTLTLLHAVEPRLSVSMPTAGSCPNYMIHGGSKGCEAGWSPEIFEGVVGYLDLYAMAAQNGRVVQILNREDNCCFGEAQYSADPADGVGARLFGISWDDALTSYEADVQAVVGMQFAVLIDETAVEHDLTEWALEQFEGLIAEETTMETRTSAYRAILVAAYSAYPDDTDDYLDAVNAAYDAGAIKIYDADDTLLCSFTLPATAFYASDEGAAELSARLCATAVAAGIPSYVTTHQNDDTHLETLTASSAGGVGEIQFAPLTFVAGEPVQLISWSRTIAE
jgi:hypothetical protein